MEELRYIHAADLHLDAPFYNLGKGEVALSERVRNASYKALDRLVCLCLAQKPDFVVFAGDNIHQEGVRPRLKLRDACATLDKAGIPVFIVHGNHDPASASLSAIEWPANTVIFDTNVSVAPVQRAGETIALVHGASHATPKENRNLAAQFHRDAQHNCFQLGLLHCTVDNSVSDRYAPCTMQDLLAADLDAWALGHAHTRQILRESPFIAYAGNIQGLYAHETNARGCLLVTARMENNKWQCQSIFHELGPVLWSTAIISMEDIKTFNALDEAINSTMIQAAHNVIDAETIILTLQLVGHTDFHNQLRRLNIMSEFGRQPIWENGKDVWLRKITLNTSPAINENNNLERDDLLGEISRLAQRLERDEQQLSEIIHEAVSPVAQAARGVLSPLDSVKQIQLLHQAKRICQDVLEGR